MLLLASGRGRRFGSEVPKVYLACRGRSLVERSLERLARLAGKREIVLAAHPEDRRRFVEPLLGTLRAAGLDRVVDGGASRQESMRNALRASNPSFPLVLVHDAARPFFPLDAARAALERAGEVGGALLAVSASDTVKAVGEGRRVERTLDRRRVWLAQTPQVARRELLERALEAADRDGFTATDDASLLEHAGYPVEVVPGSSRNIKVTTPADMELAEWIAAREDGR